MAPLRIRSWHPALLALLALSLVLVPAIPSAQAQFGGIVMTPDRGPGGIYQIGEPIRVTFQLPQPGFVRVRLVTPAGAREVYQAETPTTAGSFSLVAGPPAGEHQLYLELQVGGRTIGVGQTSYTVSGGNPNTPTIINIGCNGSASGVLNGLMDQAALTFQGTPGTIVSATGSAGGVPLQMRLQAPTGAIINSGVNTIPQTNVQVGGNWNILVTVAPVGGQAGLTTVPFSVQLTCSGGTGPIIPGGITLSVDRGNGATYAIGDPITISYQLPQPGFVRVTDQTSTGTVVIDQGYSSGTTGAINATVTAPTGLHQLGINLIVNSQTIATGVANFYVVPGSGPTPPTVTPISCNASAGGVLPNSSSQAQFIFNASGGTLVSAQVSAPIPLDLELRDPTGVSLASGTGSFPQVQLTYDGQYTLIVDEGGPLGMPLNVNFSVALSCTAPPSPPPPAPPPVIGPPAPQTGTASYPAGWNLVGGPLGTTFPVQLYQLDPTGTYTTVAPNTPIQAGQGYWAYFANATNVSLTGQGQNSVSVAAPPGQWVIIANPSPTRPATIQGADIAATYNPAVGQYAATSTLQPGQAAIALRFGGGRITVTAQ